MALATQCPHCKTIFRVAQDQLKLRGGIVRCGACHEIFDGQASLVDLAAATAAPTEVPAQAPEAIPSPPAESVTPAPAEPADDAGDEVPVYALDLGAALGPLGILPKPEAEDEDEQDATESALIDVDAGPAAAGADEAAPAGHAEDAPQSTFAHDDPEAVDDEPDAGLAQDEPQTEPVDDEPHAEQADDEPHPEAPHDDAHAATVAEVSLEEPAPASTAADPEPACTPHDGRVEPTLGQADEVLVATALSEDHALDFGSTTTALGSAQPGADHAPLPQRESADGSVFAAPPPPAKSARARQQARRSKLTPTKIDAPKLRVPEIDEPEFVKRGRQREQSGKRRLIVMTAGSVVLLLVLLTQAAVIFRNDLAARMPGTRPALTALCALLRCRVELPARIDNLTIETGELQTLGPDTYVLATLLHNQGSATQAWPDIELALTDAADKPLVRRVFAPAEYLPKGAAAGFAAHGEQAVKLYFQLDQLKPSGYHIAVFYP